MFNSSMAAFQADRPGATPGRRTISGVLLANWLLDSDNSGVLVSAVLTPESQRDLLQRVPPVHKWVKAHHMTIAFNPPLDRFEQLYKPQIGQPVRLAVVGVAQDDKAQAVLVEGPSANARPHITISCADGIPAKYSNELLSSGWTPVPRFELEAVIEAEVLTPPQPINPS